MRGYASGGRANALGNLVSLSNNFVKSSNYPSGKPGTARFHGFGDYRFDPKQPVAPAVIDDARELGRPTLYNQKNTYLADVLRWINYRQLKSGASQAPLSVVVTDLMLDDREAIDAFEASVGGALRNLMIDEKLSVGLLAVRVPFNGKVFIGDNTLDVRVPDRPLIVLLIGDPYQVRAFYDYLDTSETAPFSSGTALSDRRFALFGLEAGSIAEGTMRISGIGSGFAARSFSIAVPGTEKLRKYSFDPGAADDDRDAVLTVELQANANVNDYEVIGDEPISVGYVWQLDQDALDGTACDSAQVWSSVAKLAPSRKASTGQRVAFQLDAGEMERAGLDHRGTYLVQVIAGQRGLVSDHPAVEWMREWSQSNGVLVTRLKGSPSARRLGVPGLEPLRNLLMAELLIPGREEIERSSSQFVIRTE